jgi:hypothetical protein
MPLREEEVEQHIDRAIQRLIHTQGDIFTFTSQTNQTEWNLAHHLANEVQKEFPELSCDVDLIKPNFEYRRPDIVLHKRGTHASNFLVIEAKRHEAHMDEDLEKIKEYWFAHPLRYQFGASVVLNENGFHIIVIKNPQ